MQIRILTTGGTIEGYSKENQAEKPEIISRLIEEGRITVPVKITQVMTKDSQFITPQDRELILSHCKQCEEDKIIITHGTNTMTETAEFLAVQNLNKTVILTGSMKPAEQKGSDALFNLGSAIMALTLKNGGVYIAMHGKLFKAGVAKKNMKTKYFEETE